MMSSYIPSLLGSRGSLLLVALLLATGFGNLTAQTAEVNFDDGRLEGWSNTPKAFRLRVEDGMLHAYVDKSGMEWLVWSFPTRNLTQLPCVAFNARLSRSGTMAVWLTDELTSKALDISKAAICNYGWDKNLANYLINFSALPIDLKKVSHLVICINPLQSYKGEMWLDDLRVGLPVADVPTAMMHQP